MPSQPSVHRAILVLSIALSYSIPGRTQGLQGRFYPEKDSYMVGEPVLFNMEIKNPGAEAVYLNAKNPGSCIDTYKFSAQGSGTGCTATWDAHCHAEQSRLVQGDSYTGQWPLNFWFQFEREGKYEVSATRHIPVRSIHGDFQDFTFTSKFEVKLDPPDPLRVESILQEFERKLNSADPDERHAALDVLATTAPNYFQGVALRLSREKDPFVAVHAVGALGRMNSPETRAALSDVVTSFAESTAEDRVSARCRAIEALGQSGDASYQGLIEHYVNDKTANIQLAAMIAVAELGKSEAVPLLQRSFFSSDPVTRKNAAYALRFSMTPEAVEVLINAITDKDVSVRDRVLASLEEMTGHSVGIAAPSEKVQENWRRWWKGNKSKIAFPGLQFVCHL